MSTEEVLIYSITKKGSRFYAKSHEVDDWKLLGFLEVAVQNLKNSLEEDMEFYDEDE